MVKGTAGEKTFIALPPFRERDRGGKDRARNMAHIVIQHLEFRPAPWPFGGPRSRERSGAGRHARITPAQGQVAQELALGSRTPRRRPYRRSRPGTEIGGGPAVSGRERSRRRGHRHDLERQRRPQAARGTARNGVELEWRTAAGGQLFEVQPGRRAGTRSAAVKRGAGSAAPSCRLAQSSRRSKPSRSKPWRAWRMVPSGSTAKIEGTCVRP